MQSRLFSLRNLLIVLALWIGAFVVYRMVQSPQEAKARLAHVRHVFAVVDQHAKDHGGSWPRDWADIERTYPPEGCPPRPATWPEVRQNVEIDFKADPAKLAEAGPEEFQAIRPRGVCGDYRADVEMLLATLRGLNAEPAAAPEKKGQGVAARKP